MSIQALPAPHLDDYQQFLHSKHVEVQSAGIDIDQDMLPAQLFSFQKFVVQWALSRGQAAIFAECGLGKSFMQISWANIVHLVTGRDVLILAPLAVAGQTVAEGRKLGITVHLCRSQSDVRSGINVANYEMLSHFDAKHFVGVVLDESSILKSFTGVTKRALVEAFADTLYKLCCTATPSPNNLLELLNHSEFLRIMPSCEALMRWFINDTSQSGNYRLKGHAQKEFWAWVSSWAIALSKPSDLGPEYSDVGYVLPELVVRHVYIETDITKDVEEGQLFRAPKMSATNMHREMRLTAPDRAQAVADLVNGVAPLDFVQARDSLRSKGYTLEPTPGAYVCEEQGMALWLVTLPGQSGSQEMWTVEEIQRRASRMKGKETWIVWCHTDYEADELKQRIPDAVEVRGSEKIGVKEEKLRKFLHGEARVLIAKPRMFGYGLNLQHCHNVAFVGLSYSMEDFYQAVRRVFRFGQKQSVNVYIIAADTEGTLVATLERKLRAQIQMNQSMQVNIIQPKLEKLTLVDYAPHVPMILPPWANKNGRPIQTSALAQSCGTDWALYQGDCVGLIRGLQDHSIDFSIFSPPFANLYVYSDSQCDMGNCSNDDEFFDHFSFLIPELFRVTRPGRLCAVHCKQLVNYAGRDGTAGLRDFRGEIIHHFQKFGWVYHSEVCIWKSPVTEMHRTKAHGLLYKTLRSDASFTRQGLPDYLLLFRKWPRNEQEASLCMPVTHTRLDIPLKEWQQLASPVWDDIDQTDVLNVEQARDGQDEKHICPLQLQVIRRALRLWTNPGDIILSPFSGIGSEGYEALRLSRKFIGFELKLAYYLAAQKHLKRALEARTQATLFSSEDLATLLPTSSSDNGDEVEEELEEADEVSA